MDRTRQSVEPTVESMKPVLDIEFTWLIEQLSLTYFLTLHLCLRLRSRFRPSSTISRKPLNNKERIWKQGWNIYYVILQPFTEILLERITGFASFRKLTHIKQYVLCIGKSSNAKELIIMHSIQVFLHDWQHYFVDHRHPPSTPDLRTHPEMSSVGIVWTDGGHSYRRCVGPVHMCITRHCTMYYCIM